MRALLTLSGLNLAAICPGSVALPRYASASAAAGGGNAGHEYTQVLLTDGRDAAEEAAPAIARHWGLSPEAEDEFRRRARAFNPPIPKGAICEQPLAFLEDGSVVPVEGGRGAYEVPEGTIFAGTPDVVWTEPEPIRVERDASGRVLHAAAPPGTVAWCADLKWGRDEHVPPVEQNLQLIGGSLMIARWTGAELVVPAIVFTGFGNAAGRWETPQDVNGRAVPLRPEDHARAEAQIRRMAAVAREQVDIYASHGSGKLSLRTGPHCAWCPARAACPAQAGEVHALVHGVPSFAGALDRDTASKAAGILVRMTGLVERMKHVLRAYVEEHGPITLADGRLWGPREQNERRYRTRPTYEALVQVLLDFVPIEEAERLADEAFRTSNTAIVESIRKALALAGRRRGIKASMMKLTAELAARDGLTEEVRQRWSAYFQAAAADDGSEDGAEEETGDG
ncbi:MAG: hypothetical protein ACTHU0_21640 [Kofleriaceae bacterium]